MGIFTVLTGVDGDSVWRSIQFGVYNVVRSLW
jgi:hypothetical protein